MKLSPVTTIAGYAKPREAVWFHSLPVDESTCRSIFHHGDEQAAWLRLRRRLEPPPPSIPSEFKPWLGPEQISDATAPTLNEAIEPANVEETRVVLADHPEVSAAWEAWVKQTWSPWADEHREWQIHAALHRSLFRAREELLGQEDATEIVLGLGLLRWTPARGEATIRRHLLTCRGELRLESKTGELSIVPGADGFSVRLELDMLPDHTRALVQRQLGLTADRTDIDGATDQEGIEALLKQIAHTINERLGYEMTVDEPDKEGISFSPACFFRPRGSRALHQLLQTISESDTKTSGLWRLIAEETEPDQPSGEAGSRQHQDSDFLYFPSASNDEQSKIVQRVGSSAGVVVQGPPGTGKSHTIGNLISHLLAKGERVLVTAHTSQALQVLRSKLHMDLQPLCVSLLGAGTESSKDLERSVTGIIHRKDTDDVNALKTKAERAEKEALSLEERLRLLDRQLCEAREAEARPVSPVVGYSGTLTELGQRLRAETDDLGWIQGDVSPTIDPLDEGDFAELLQYQTTLNPDVLAEVQLPAVSLPVDPVTMIGLVAAVVKHRSAIELPGDPVQKPPADINALTALLNSLVVWWQDARHDGSWTRPALQECLKGQSPRWTALTQESARALKRLPADLNVPRFTCVDESRLSAVLDSMKRLDAHLSAGGRLRTLIVLKPSVVKETEHVFQEARMGDAPVTGPRELPAAIAAAEVRVAIDAILLAWRRVGQEVDATTRPAEISARLHHSHDLLTRLTGLAAQRSELTPEAKELLDSIDSPEALATNLAALIKTTALAQLRASELALREANTSFEGANPAPRSASCDGLIAAVTAESAVDCRARLDEIDAFHSRRESYINYRRQIEIIRKGASVLASALERRQGSEPFPALGTGFHAAWRHAQLRTWLKHHRPEAITEDAESLRRALEGKKAIAATGRAWGHALTRLTTKGQQSLVAWQAAVQKIPKTPTAKSYARRRSDAQRSLEACLGQIPAWVIPLNKLYETVSAEPEQFDTIIIDEASQCGLDSLLLMFLAKKIIVVGDDKQVSPQSVAVEDERITNLQKTFLKDFQYRSTFDLSSSLFEHASRCFPQRLSLREHYRCVPRIIEFSNRLCYPGSPLIPLRQVSSDGLAPLRSVYVQDGTRKRDINAPEAARVAETILECHNDERYDGLTFGAICLQGHDQAAEISRLVNDRMGAEAVEEREFRAGTAADFQGAERDVMFLSMVAAPDVNNAPLTTPPYERSFNVAMSRAKEQVWLFHSVNPEHLSPACLRRRLLNYFLEKPEPIADQDWVSLRMKAKQKGRNRQILPPPFDSWFEIDVALDLANRGFFVRPQFEVARYSIDLVLEDGDARLAIECDGDQFHGQDQFLKDLHRQRMLERAGWRFVRVPASRYYGDPVSEIDRIVQVAEEFGVLPAGARSVAKVEPVMNEPDSSPAQSSEALEIAVAAPTPAATLPFSQADPSFDPFTDYTEERGFPSPEAPPGEIRSAVLEIISGAGPTTKAAIYRLYVKGCPYVERAAKSLRSAINRSLYSLVRASQIETKDEGGGRRPEDEVVFLKGRPSVHVRPGGGRDIEEVPLSELAERLKSAGARTLQSKIGRDEILREALKEAGFSSLTAPRRQRLELAWRFLESQPD